MYWRKHSHPSDFVSPFAEYKAVPERDRKYVTFEPDPGGFNNIRMAFETVVVYAKAYTYISRRHTRTPVCNHSHTRASSQATGSVLVLPPIQRLYLLKQPSDKVTRTEPILWMLLSLPSAPLLLGMI